MNNAMARVARLLAVAVLGVVFAASLGGPRNGTPAATLINAFRWVVGGGAARSSLWRAVFKA
ncbi:MAG: hypothetical protein ABJA84_11255 [Polaromonas sp.]